MPWIMGLAIIGVIYGALVALAQTDLKRLVAYSSVSHLGYCMLGLFAVDMLGVQGGSLQMINHGLSTGGLFALVGMLYDRYHTRQIADFGGLARRLPVFSFFFVLFTLSSIGLPGLNNFAGEILLLLGTFQRAWAAPPANWVHAGPIVAVLAVFGLILGAWYMLQLVQRICFGPLREPRHDQSAGPVRDLGTREVLALAPLVVFVVWIGLQPSFFLGRMAPTLDASSPRPVAWWRLKRRPPSRAAGRTQRLSDNDSPLPWRERGRERGSVRARLETTLQRPLPVPPQVLPGAAAGAARAGAAKAGVIKSTGKAGPQTAREADA